MRKAHEMRMVGTEESGLEEWACPTCGRRLMLRWPPHYEKLVVEPGDELAGHVGALETTTGPAPGERERRWLRETGKGPLTGHPEMI
ncbi:hypothetical protein AGRA3207_000330 [Actinomadura graeca]|uniref:Uncharacterized protein n=1 Tax=Actinomadura graeca TaxID=2750812 RepID=A0ABX8QSH1_9ACTN|nr:hypothetical protein [Actinomadura graeca]QXJ19748.1 hypothetical protein AGRA3207_000330 [Actinomadura graeca]